MSGAGNVCRILYRTHVGIRILTSLPSFPWIHDIYCLYAINLYDLLQIALFSPTNRSYPLLNAVSRTSLSKQTNEKAGISVTRFLSPYISSRSFNAALQHNVSSSMCMSTQASQLHSFTSSPRCLLMISSPLWLLLTRASISSSVYIGWNRKGVVPPSWMSMSLSVNRHYPTLNSDSWCDKCCFTMYSRFGSQWCTQTKYDLRTLGKFHTFIKAVL